MVPGGEQLSADLGSSLRLWSRNNPPPGGFQVVSRWLLVVPGGFQVPGNEQLSADLGSSRLRFGNNPPPPGSPSRGPEGPHFQINCLIIGLRLKSRLAATCRARWRNPFILDQSNCLSSQNIFDTQPIRSLLFLTEEQKILLNSPAWPPPGPALNSLTLTHSTVQAGSSVLSCAGLGARGAEGEPSQGRRGAERGRAQVRCQLQTPSCSSSSCSQESPPVSSLAPAHQLP